MAEPVEAPEATAPEPVVPTPPSLSADVPEEAEAAAPSSPVLAGHGVTAEDLRSLGLDATDVVGGWANAAHSLAENRESGGLVFPTRRRVVLGATTVSPRWTVRMAASRSSGGASLRRNPDAPAWSAANACSSRSKVVSTSTLVRPRAS